MITTTEKRILDAADNLVTAKKSDGFNKLSESEQIIVGEAIRCLYKIVKRIAKDQE
jgi:hypothetical protein